uniref:Centromere protein A n=1 Tax=Mus musculus TaxID=10090 RepID=A0A0G2JEV0_MOUSE
MGPRRKPQTPRRRPSSPAPGPSRQSSSVALEMEPRTPCMLGKGSTTELYPQPSPRPFFF